MVDYQQLVDADPAKFSTAAEAYGTFSTVLNDQLDNLGTQATGLADAWTGEDQVGGTAAVEYVGTQNSSISAAAGELSTIQSALVTLADSITLAQGDIDDAKEDAEAIPATVNSDGSVTVNWSQIDTDDLEPSDLSLLRTAKNGEATRVEQAIEDAVTKATEADEEAAAAIAAIPPQADPGGGSPPSEMPGDDWSPEQVNEWWNALSSQERQYLLANEAEMIGSMNGVPTVYRDLANRSHLNAEIARLEAETAWQQFVEAGDDVGAGELRKLDELAELRHIRDQLEATDPDQRRYLLGFDVDQNRLIMSIGNPDTADNVFTFVPGALNGFGTYEDALGRVDLMVSDANGVDGSSNAGIMWLDYDSPTVGTFSESNARAASDDLQDFQSSLRATHHDGPPSTNTLVGHSYGATVTGVAARGGIDADQLMFLGSIGTGGDTVAGLGLDPGDVYAGVTERDYEAQTPIHGTSPHQEDFGATAFDAGDGRHSDYWEGGNQDGSSRDQMADIITGNGDQITPLEYDEEAHHYSDGRPSWITR